MRLWFVHFVRWGLLALIVLTIHIRHAQLTERPADAPAITASLTEIQQLLPATDSLGPVDTAHAGRTLLDAAGETIGFVVETAPQADDIVGYSGPNNVLLVFNANNRLAGLKLLASGDTDDHVAKVRSDPRFLASFEGKTWSELTELQNIDAVSGATLTSVAIVAGIIKRLDGAAPNLRFPDPPTLEEIAPLYPEAALLVAGSSPTEWIVQDKTGKRLGYVLRTSPLTDERFGYQGPTDGLLALDATGKTVVGIGINKSYDNTRYVKDIGFAWGFMHRFDGMPLSEFAGLSVGIGKEIEGVSGATMTSQTLTRNLVDIAQHRLDSLKTPTAAPSSQASAPWWQSVDWPTFRGSDYGMILILIAGGFMAFTNLRGRKWIRRGWQLLLIVYVGYMSGAFVSQALLVGWSRNGVPWRIAPGLVMLTAAALIVPFATKTQIYCHQLCPHGAAQELLKRRVPWQWRMPGWLERCLKFIPAALLVFVFAVTMVPWSTNLASVEPFDAWLWKTAGWVTMAIAIIGLLASLFVPMAYCRFGCPTGALLSYLRRNARSDRLTRQDALAAALAIAGTIVISY